ncbi:MAG: cupin domain-containing protein [Saprospiraceae bacterium]
MVSSEIEKAKPYVLVEIVEYIANSVVTKTILKKMTGTICLMSVDMGEGISEKTTPFDTFVQIIEGEAEILISDNVTHLHNGESIIIPAHAKNSIKPNGRFKMIQTVIKSGYE